jgi:hypothetical protein
MPVRGQHMEIDGEEPLDAIVLAGTPPIFPCWTKSRPRSRC